MLCCCLLVKVQHLSLAWAGLHDTESLWALFQEPIVEFRLGYPIFYLGTSKFSPQQSLKKKKAPDWLDSSRMANLIFLTQHGLSYNMILIPYLVVKEVWSIAKLATRVPMNQCWFSPALLCLWFCFYLPKNGIKRKEEMNCLWLYEILDEEYVEWTCIKVIISLCT